MKRLHILSFTALFAVLMLVGSVVVRAQVPRSGGTENTQLAQQYQQVLAERTKLQADNEQLKKQLDAAQQALDSSKHKLASSGVDAAKLQAQLNAAETSDETSKKTLEQMRARMQELVARFRDTIEKTRAVEIERNKLQEQLTGSTTSLNTCSDRNVQMFRINAELLDRLQHQGFFSRVSRAEPFTQIERTRLDNLVLEDRQRIDALHVAKPDISQSGASAASTAAATTGQQ